MRFKLTIFCLVFFFCSSVGASENFHLKKKNVAQFKNSKDSWFEVDKLDHFLASAFFTGLGYGTFRNNLNKSVQTSIVFSTSITLGLGISKEAYDSVSRNGNPSFKDLVADLAGIIFMTVLIKVL